MILLHVIILENLIDDATRFSRALTNEREGERATQKRKKKERTYETREKIRGEVHLSNSAFSSARLNVVFLALVRDTHFNSK